MEYKLETINCPFCKSSLFKTVLKNAEEFYLGSRERFNVVKCLECGFIFTNPRPTKDTIACFYPNDAGYYIPKFKGTGSDQSGLGKLKKMIRHSVLKHTFEYDLKTPFGKLLTYPISVVFSKRFALQHTPGFIKNGRLLDIGCSWGGYLSKMRDYGWNVFGTEINEKAVQHARKELGLTQVRQGFFEDLDWEDSYFDVVNMKMVLEHLYNPQQSLNLVNRILKAEGQLILSVPDITGFESRVYKQYFHSLHVPQHLSHFSPDTISKFLVKSGFKVEKIIHHTFDRDLVASASYLKNQILFKILNNRLIRKTIVKIAVNGLSMLSMTSRMTVYARKG